MAAQHLAPARDARAAQWRGPLSADCPRALPLFPLSLRGGALLSALTLSLSLSLHRGVRSSAPPPSSSLSRERTAALSAINPPPSSSD